MDDARVSNNNRMIRYIKVNVSIRSNQNIISNVHFSYNRRIDTHRNTIANRRYTFSLASVFPPNCTTLMKIDILTQDCTLSNCNIVRMTQIDPFSYFRKRRNLQPIFSRIMIQHYSQ